MIVETNAALWPTNRLRTMRPGETDFTVMPIDSSMRASEVVVFGASDMVTP